MANPKFYLDINKFDKGISYKAVQVKILEHLMATREPFSFEELASALEVEDAEFDHFAHALFHLEGTARVKNQLEDLSQGPDKTWEEGAKEYNEGKQASFVITKNGIYTLSRTKQQEMLRKDMQIEEEVRQQMGCRLCEYYVFDKESLPKDHLRCPINHESAANLQICDHYSEKRNYFRRDIPLPVPPGWLLDKLTRESLRD